MARRSRQGLTLRTHEWGTGIERNFGFDTTETWLTIGGSALSQVASAVPDEAASPIELIGLWLAGDSAASAELRLRLDAFGLQYEFRMRQGSRLIPRA